MSTADRDGILRNLVRARWMPNGEGRIETCEMAVREADSIGDLPLAFLARLELIDAALFGGRSEKLLVAFAWCLSRHLEDPAGFLAARLPFVDEDGGVREFDAGDLLWRVKYALEVLPRFADVPIGPILDTFGQAKEVFLAHGRSLRPWHQLRSDAAWWFGRPDERRSYGKLAAEAPRDEGADCLACERNDRVRGLIEEERYESAVLEAAPILRGEQSCALVPETTMARLLVPLLALGRPREARVLHQTNWPRIRGRRQFAVTAAEHMEYLALAGEEEAALEALRQHVRFAEEARETGNRFGFYVRARLVLTAIERVDGGPELRGEVEVRAAEATRALDDRNGNRFFRDLATRWQERISFRRAP